MKQQPGRTERVSCGFIIAATSVLVGALSITIATGILIWDLVGIDELVARLQMPGETGIWLNLMFLSWSVVLLIPASGITVWWLSVYFVRTIQFGASLRPHPNWVRLWEQSLQFREELRQRVPLIYWYTKVTRKFGTDVRHPRMTGRNWAKAFLTVVFTVSALTLIPHWLKQWSPPWLPLGMKPLFSLLMIVSAPILADIILHKLPEPGERPPINHWQVAPPMLNENNNHLPPP